MKLTECRNEEERRKNFPQLCAIADMIEAAPDPKALIKAVIKAALYIIAERKKELHDEG